MRRHDHAATHPFAVQPLTVAHASLNGMAKGMAKIENGAQARFALVLSHHPGLDLTTALDCMRQRLRVTRHEGRHVVLNPIEKSHVGNRPVLDDFGQAGAQLALRQGLERVQIAHHFQRLVKRANHVFAQRVVDGGLASHAGIHLGQQGGGHLHKRHTPHVTGCGKTGHVTHHTAAQGKQHSLAVTGVGQQRIKNQVQTLPSLELLSIRQDNGVNAGIFTVQSFLQTLGIQRTHGGVGHDQRAGGTWQLGIAQRVVKQRTPNGNVVAALLQINGDGLEVGYVHTREFRGRFIRQCGRGKFPTSQSGARQHPSQFKLHHDHVDQGRHRRPSRVNNEMRRFPVQGITGFVEITKPP